MKRIKINAMDFTAEIFSDFMPARQFKTKNIDFLTEFFKSITRWSWKILDDNKPFIKPRILAIF